MERDDYTQQFFKTRMCRFHMRGKCFKGAECSHAHSRDELLRKPILRKTSLCRHWVNTGSCGKGQGCPYAHGSYELRAPIRFTEEARKTQDDVQRFTLNRDVAVETPTDHARHIFPPSLMEPESEPIRHGDSPSTTDVPSENLPPRARRRRRSTKLRMNFVYYHPQHCFYYYPPSFTTAMGTAFQYSTEVLLRHRIDPDYDSSPRSWTTEHNQD